MATITVTVSGNPPTAPSGQAVHPGDDVNWQIQNPQSGDKLDVVCGDPDETFTQHGHPVQHHFTYKRKHRSNNMNYSLTLTNGANSTPVPGLFLVIDTLPDTKQPDPCDGDDDDHRNRGRDGREERS